MTSPSTTAHTGDSGPQDHSAAENFLPLSDVTAAHHPGLTRLNLFSVVLDLIRCLINLVQPKWTAYVARSHTRSRPRPSHSPTTRSLIRATSRPRAPFTVCALHSIPFSIFSSHVYLLYCIFIVPFLYLAIQMLSTALRPPTVSTAVAAVQAGAPGQRLRVWLRCVAGGAVSV